MLVGRRDSARQARAVFGEALRAQLGQPRRLRPLPSSPRSRVWRGPAHGQPVVIKQIVAGADADQRFSRELTALRLAARVDPPVVPTLLGADPDARVLVLQRLAGRTGRGLAARLCRRSGPVPCRRPARRRGDVARLGRPGGRRCHAFLTLAEWLGVAVPSAVAADLNAVVGRSEQSSRAVPAAWRSVPGQSGGDPAGVRFFDLEQVALGDGLVELAYLRMGFPTCWCVTSVAEPVLRVAEQAYRDTWLAETGEPVGGDLTEACIGWLMRGDALVARAERGTADQLARLSLPTGGGEP